MADRVRIYSRKPQRYAVVWTVGATELGEPILASEDRDTLRKATLLAKKHHGRVFERDVVVKVGRESWEADESCISDFGSE